MFADWDLAKPLVDVMKLARGWETPSGGKPRTEPHGWPLEDARITVWADLAGMNGTYKLSFTGQASIIAGWVGWPDGRVANHSYNPLTNTTTADVIIDSSEKMTLQLSFEGTSGGIKNVKLIRPGYTGGETFTTSYKQALGKASVIRFMDFANTNNNSEVNWSDRKSPAYYSQAVAADGTQSGSAWEYAIQLSNELKRDAWINVPINATDDYIVKLAQLWRDGDTVEGVAYPGLDPGLKIYLEYGNEVWNSDFNTHRLNLAAAVAEVRAGHSNLNYDGSSVEDNWAWRRTGRRIKEISDGFRSVFGDAAMGARIRPVLTAQSGFSEPGRQGLLFLENAFGSQHPVNYYLYGFGGGPYYHPDNDSDALTLDTFFAALLSPWWLKEVQVDTDWAAAYGLKHVAYEGGPSLDKTGHSESVKAAAVKDPRMTAAMVRQHQAWTANGGDLFMYYVVAWDYQWGFTDNINNLDTPKYRALDQIAGTTQGPLTYGASVPANLNAGRWSITSGLAQPGDGPITLKPLESSSLFDLASAYWTAYTIRADTPGAYQLSATYFGNQPGELQIVVDGNPVGAVGVQNTGGADQATGPLSVTLGKGLHSIRLQSQRGQFNVRSVNITATPAPPPAQPTLPPVQDMLPPVQDAPPAVDAPPTEGGVPDMMTNDESPPGPELVPADEEGAPTPTL
jgi:hypothetical protein